MSPSAENDAFTRAKQSPDGQWWSDGGITMCFKMSGNRADGFDVQIEDGSVVSCARRTP